MNDLRITDMVIDYLSKRASFKRAEAALSDMLPSGLTPQSFLVLRFVQHGENIKLDLADYLGVTAPQITALTDGLRRQGLISQKKGKEDHRERVIKITAKGKRVLEGIS